MSVWFCSTMFDHVWFLQKLWLFRIYVLLSHVVQCHEFCVFAAVVLVWSTVAWLSSCQKTCLIYGLITKLSPTLLWRYKCVVRWKPGDTSLISVEQLDTDTGVENRVDSLAPLLMVSVRVSDETWWNICGCRVDVFQMRLKGHGDMIHRLTDWPFLLFESILAAEALATIVTPG